MSARTFASADPAVAAPRPRIALLAISGVLGVAVLLAVAFMFGPMRHGQLALIDDHEILRFLGGAHAISPWNIPRILLEETEVGRWGVADRYRPAYYLGRIVESALWRDNGFWWYGARLAAVVVFATWAGAFVVRRTWPVSTRAGRRAASIVLGALTSAAVVAMPAWGDIVTRLGPSEVYVALALIPFVMGAWTAWTAPMRRRGWILLGAGFVLASGSKEDALLLLIPLAVLGVLRMPSSPRRAIFACVVLGLCALFGGWIALGLILGTSESGADMYGNGRTLALFLKVLPTVTPVWTCALAVVSALLLEQHPRATGVGFVRFRNAVASRPLSVLVACCAIVAAGDVYFYQNYVSDGLFLPARYGMLSFLAAVAALVAVASLALHRRWTRRALERVGLVAAVSALVAFPTLPSLASASAMRMTSVVLSGASENVHAEILAGVQAIKQEPGGQAVVIIHRATDYERALALPQFLSYYGGHPQVYLQYQGDDTVDPTPLDGRIDTELREIARSGRDSGGWRIRAWSGYEPATPAVCFVFTRTQVELNCSSIRQIG